MKNQNNKSLIIKISSSILYFIVMPLLYSLLYIIYHSNLLLFYAYTLSNKQKKKNYFQFSYSQLFSSNSFKSLQFSW